MRVQREGGRGALCLACLENAQTAWMERPGVHQFPDRAAALVVWVDLDERFGPVTAVGVLFLYLVPDVGGCDLDEAAGETCILLNEFVSKLEDVVHGRYVSGGSVSGFCAGDSGRLMSRGLSPW